MASVAVFVALGGGAYAATGGLVSGDGAIKGCVAKKGGLKVVKAGKSCPKGTKTLTFDQKGPQGAQGALGTQGAQGPQGPAGITGQTRWGNVLIASEGSEQVIATIGPFTITAKCEKGEGAYLLTTTANGDWAYGEDGGDEELTPGKPLEFSDDEDYDEAIYAWSPSTGTSFNGNTFIWDVGDGSPSSCEFQGLLTQTS